MFLKCVNAQTLKDIKLKLLFELSANDSLSCCNIVGLTYHVHDGVQVAKVLHFNDDYKIMLSKDMIYVLYTIYPVKFVIGNSLLSRQHIHHRYADYHLITTHE
jgi:hypothetical protein